MHNYKFKYLKEEGKYQLQYRSTLYKNIRMKIWLAWWNKEGARKESEEKEI